jgi:hypothetical protein
MSAWQTVDGEARLYRHVRRVRGCWQLGTIALGLPDRGLLVYSPTAGLTDEDRAGLVALGEPRLFVAPNHYHHLGLPEWLARHPGVRCVASPAARPRLEKKQPGIAFADPESIELPPGVRLVAAPTRSGELWLFVETARGRALVVGDAFMNVNLPPRGFTGAMLRLIKAAPGPAIPTTFTRMAVGDQAPYRAFTRQLLEAERPTLLVPCHGDPLSGPELPEQLTALMARRFGSA